MSKKALTFLNAVYIGIYSVFHMQSDHYLCSYFSFQILIRVGVNELKTKDKKTIRQQLDQYYVLRYCL